MGGVFSLGAKVVSIHQSPTVNGSVYFPHLLVGGRWALFVVNRRDSPCALLLLGTSFTSVGSCLDAARQKLDDDTKQADANRPTRGAIVTHLLLQGAEPRISSDLKPRSLRRQSERPRKDAATSLHLNFAGVRVKLALAHRMQLE